MVDGIATRLSRVHHTMAMRCASLCIRGFSCFLPPPPATFIGFRPKLIHTNAARPPARQAAQGRAGEKGGDQGRTCFGTGSDVSATVHGTGRSLAIDCDRPKRNPPTVGGWSMP